MSVKRPAPYKHSDGSDCYTKNCKTRIKDRGKIVAAENKHDFNKMLEEIESNQPVLGLDLDGVVLGYEDGARNDFAASKNLPRSAFGPMTHYSTIESGWPLKDEEEFRTLHAQAVENGLYEKLEPLPGAVEAIQRLARDGYKIHVITSRFVRPGQHAEVVRQTMLSLDKIGVPVKSITFTADKAQINADVYIDDAPYNIESLRNHNKKVVVYGQAYNKEYDNRATNWDEAEAMIRAAAPLRTTNN